MRRGGYESIENHYAHLLSGEYFANIFVVERLNSVHDEQGEKQFLRVTDEELLKKSGGAWSAWIQQRLHTQQ